MYCKNCGRENDENAKFCQYCGNDLSFVNVYEPQPGEPQAQYVQPEPAAPQSQEYHYNEYPYQNYDNSAFAPHPVIEVTRKSLCSPLFLIATILATLQVVFSIFFALIDSSSIYLYQLGSLSYYLPGDMDDVFSLGSGTGGILGILMVIGLWITFASAVGKGKLSTGGLTLIKVMSVIYLVVGCIAGVVLVVIGIILAVGINYINYSYYEMYYSLGVSVITLLLIVIGAVIVLVVLMIIFYAKLNGTVTRVKIAATTGVVTKGASIYVIVLLFLMGIGSVISAFTFTYFPLYMVYSFVVAAVDILFAVLLIKYRANIRAVM